MQSLWDAHLEDVKGSSDCSTHNSDVHVKTNNSLLHLQLNPFMQDHIRSGEAELLWMSAKSVCCPLGCVLEGQNGVIIANIIAGPEHCKLECVFSSAVLCPGS